VWKDCALILDLDVFKSDSDDPTNPATTNGEGFAVVAVHVHGYVVFRVDRVRNSARPASTVVDEQYRITPECLLLCGIYQLCSQSRADLARVGPRASPILYRGGVDDPARSGSGRVGDGGGCGRLGGDDEYAAGESNGHLNHRHVCESLGRHEGSAGHTIVRQYPVAVYPRRLCELYLVDYCGGDRTPGLLCRPARDDWCRFMYNSDLLKSLVPQGYYYYQH